MNIIILVAYVAVSVFNYGALAADFKQEFKEFNRQDQSVIIFFSIIPIVGLALAIFSTGFFEVGFYYGPAAKRKRSF